MQPPTILLPESYEVGEKVDVLYNRAQPAFAKIDSFRNLWTYPLQALSLAGFLLWVAFMRWLKAFIPGFLARVGTEVEAEFTHVTTRISVMNKGRIWYVHVEYKDAEKDQIYFFKSEPLKFDPSWQLTLGQKLRVIYNPNNPRMHHVDIDGLAPQKIAKEETSEDVSDKSE